MQVLDVVEGRMVADTLGKIAGKGIAADSDVVFAAKNESAGVER